MTSIIKSSYPRFHIKFTLNGKVVNCVTSKKSLRIMHRIKLSESKFKWDRVFLRFRYDKDSVNEGCYQNSRDLISVYRCFMEIVPEFKKERK